jgi:hypothetical protein
MKYTWTLIIILLMPLVKAEGLTVNFTKNNGTLPLDYIGTNTHGQQGANYSWIDVNHDGTLDTRADFMWIRSAWTNTSLGDMRADMYLNIISDSNGSFHNTSTSNVDNIAARRELTDYAAANGIKITWTASYMPTWLSDNASTCTTDKKTCNPSNYPRWGQLVTDYLSAVGCDTHPGTCKVEVWNEPDLRQFFVKDGTCDDAILGYNKIYNQTYHDIKVSNMSEILVFGPAVSDSADNNFPTNCGWLITRSFLGNFSNSTDGISYHDYWDGLLSTASDYAVRSDFIVNGIDQHIAAAGMNKNTVNRYVTEMQLHYSGGQLNNDSNYTYQMGLWQIYNLDKYPNTTRYDFYQNHEECGYGNYACYDQYPLRFAWLSEPQLNNSKYAPYNESVDWSQAHPPGSIVVQTNRTTNLRILCTNNTGTNYTCTVANKNTAVTALTMVISGLDNLTNVTQSSNNTVYTITNGLVDLGNLPPLSIQHYAINRQTNSCGTVNRKQIIMWAGLAFYVADLTCPAPTTPTYSLTKTCNKVSCI